VGKQGHRHHLMDVVPATGDLNYRATKALPVVA
jgi:hypothetical protein